MRNCRTQLVRFGQKGVALCIALLLSATLAYPVLPARDAHAALSVVEVGKNLVVNTLTSQLSGSLLAIESEELFRENILEGIAWSIAKIALQQISQSIVNWINSGFQGSPAFVTDLNGFLLDIADQAAGDFIYNGPLQALCSPFRIDIQFALALQYQQNRDPAEKLACRASDVVENVQGSLAGSMRGWSDWFNVTLVPQNNLYGALFIAQHEFGLAITGAQGEEATLLNFGEGFLSFKDCSEVEGGSGKCKIVTPGQVIEERLNEALGLGEKSLIEADEINEIIAALFGQLAQQAITGVNGLFGLSSGSYNGGASYLEQMGEQTDNYIGFEGAGSSDPIGYALSVEGDWLALNQEVVALVEDAEAILQEAGSCTNRSLPGSFADAKEDAETEIIATNSMIDELAALQDAYNSATTPEEEAAILEQFMQLQADGLLHTESDVFLFEIEVDEFEDEVNQFISRVQQDINNCSTTSSGSVGSER